MKLILSFLTLFAVCFACTVKPQPIQYGVDSCHFCKMTIVDDQHAAEIVTVKGKVYKYDAVECLLNHKNNWEHPKIKHLLVCDYAHPGKLVDANLAHYLISKNIPSPMGEFLTAFSKKEELQKVMDESGGEILNWSTLNEKFNIH